MAEFQATDFFITDLRHAQNKKAFSLKFLMKNLDFFITKSYRLFNFLSGNHPEFSSELISYQTER